jgi:hypothetical protein
MLARMASEHLRLAFNRLFSQRGGRLGAGFVALLVLHCQAYALPDDGVVLSTSITDSELTGPPVLDDRTTGSVGLSTVDYFNAAGSGRPSLFDQVEGHILTQGTGSIFQGKLNAEGLAIVKPATAYTFEAPEAYVGTSPMLSETVQIKVGRELHHWSHLDEEFELGIWQPRERWDYVHPEEVGLAGVFIDVEKPAFQFTVMGSPIFVPDRGVPEEFQNGGIYSDSNYFSGPATTFNFNNVPTAVNYSLAAPSTMSVVENKAFSTMARVGYDQGPWASYAYAYKPMNQLLFSYADDLSEANYNNPSGSATIYPRVAYESVMSAETGFESNHFGFWFSGLYDRPIDDQPILGQTYQTVDTAYAVSPALEYRLGNLKSDPTRFQVAALRVWGGDPADQGTDATGSGSIFDARFPYQTAGIFQFNTPMDWMGLPQLHIRYKMLYDFGHSGNIQSTDFDYQMQRSLLLNLGADILTSHEDDSATDPISEFRGDDCIRMGMSYVF